MKRTMPKVSIAISNAIILIFMGGYVNTVMTEEVYSPKFNPADFAKEVNNKYFTLIPGNIVEIIRLDESVKIPYSPSYHNCLKTKNWTPLEPDIVEYKYYSYEVSGVLLETIADGTDRMELINIITN